MMRLSHPIGRNAVGVGFVLTAIAASLLGSTAAIAESAANEDLGEYRGQWLRTDTAEVFIAVEPAFRLLQFRSLGGESLFSDAADVGEIGLRLAVMEPEQNAESGAPGAQAGEIVELDDGRATVRLRPANGLRYEIDLSLRDDAPVLEAAYRLHNESDAERAVACWSMISYELDGRIVAPFGEAPRTRRRVVLPWWASWPQPGVAWGRRAMAADVATPLNGHTYKVGVITDSGWLAFVRGRSALVSSAPFDPAATYPEDGANVTFFVLDKERRWCETEQVGALQRVAPGGYAELRETLTLVELPDAPDEPDALRETIEKALGR